MLRIGEPVSPTRFQFCKAFFPFSHTSTELSSRFFIRKTQHKFSTKQERLSSVAVFNYPINQTTAFFSSSLSSTSFTNVWSFFSCRGLVFQKRLHAYQSDAFSKSFGLSSISCWPCFVFLSSNTFVIRGCCIWCLSFFLAFICSGDSLFH